MLLREVRKFLALPSSDRALLVRAYVALGQVDVDLRVLRFQGIVARAERGDVVPSAEVTIDDARRAERYRHWIEVAARYHVVRARCLHRALVLHRWLRAEHLPSQLQIGVRKDGAALSAHAWVELAGRVIDNGGDGLAAFARLAAAHPQR